MRKAAPYIFAAVVVGVIALGILSAASRPERGGAPRSEALRERAEQPSLALGGVEFREFRPDGTTISLRSERATYGIIGHDLSARGVTVAVPTSAGEVVFNAPVAMWDVNAGIVRLPDGGRAEGVGGWSATVPDARLDLPARRMTASDASLAGPGLALEGRNFVWSWKDGTMTMETPRGHVLPGKVAPRDA